MVIKKMEDVHSTWEHPLILPIERSMYPPIVQALCLLIVHAILPVKLIDTSARLGSLLLSGIERMALRTDFNVDILLGRTGNEGISAVACHSCLLIIWMDSCFHDFTSLYYIKIEVSIFLFCAVSSLDSFIIVAYVNYICKFFLKILM